MKHINNAVSSFFFTGFLLLALGAVAFLTKLPFIFPSLGPTAFLISIDPLAKNSSPKHVVLGHLIGAICGYLSLQIFQLIDVQAMYISGVSLAYVGAAALALALTSFFMIIFSVEHPPAGATTLIVSLGVIHTIANLIIIMISVILLCTVSRIILNKRGIKYPLWSLTKSRR